MAPVSQGMKWEDPAEFAEQAESCPSEEEGTPQARVQVSKEPPKAPEIASRVQGSEMVVTFRQQGMAGGERQGVEIAVLARNEGVTPTVATSLRRNGTVRIPLPNSPGPYSVAARSIGESGVAGVTTYSEDHPRIKPRPRPALGRPSDLSPSVRERVLFEIEVARKVANVPQAVLDERERRIRDAGAEAR